MGRRFNQASALSGPSAAPRQALESVRKLDRSCLTAASVGSESRLSGPEGEWDPPRSADVGLCVLVGLLLESVSAFLSTWQRARSDRSAN